jgi:hypothetical protein
MPISKKEIKRKWDKQHNESKKIKRRIIKLLKSEPDSYFSWLEIMNAVSASPRMLSDALGSLIRGRKILEQNLYEASYYTINPDILIKKK